MTPQSLYLSIVPKHEKKLRTYALQLTSDQDDANDLFQDTCLSAFRFIHQFQEGTNAMGWLATIMRNRFTNLYRKKKLTPEMVSYQEVSIPERSVLSDTMTKALDVLSPNQKTIFLMAYVQDYSYEEIASITRTPKGTIRSKLHRCKQILSSELKYKQIL
ncbi:RNA polymerase sigma factor [Pedobacter sp.]|uniref:RNA polymerase sigma factor n=1 Tax=Pedobacter sp. TaxID=1411316 RepID=UPI003C59A1D7